MSRLDRAGAAAGWLLIGGLLGLGFVAGCTVKALIP